MKSVWQSKLSKSYPMADPKGKLSGQDYKLIDPVLAGRLAACCAMNLTEGKRSSERQKELYRQKQAGIIKSCAKPGTSYHEFGLAIDTSSQPIRGMTNAQLAKFGLCKPLSKEGWHIQPIETMRLGIDASVPAAKKLWPVDLSPLLKAKFDLADSTVDYLAGCVRAEQLFAGLLAGKKGFSPEVINYIKAYEYGDALMARLGL